MKTTQRKGNLEAKKQGSDNVTALSQQMWISWFGSHRFLRVYANKNLRINKKYRGLQNLIHMEIRG